MRIATSVISGPRFVIIGAVAALILSIILLTASAHASAPNIAAASDLKYPLDEIAASYLKATGRMVKITYGSSGLITAQIMNGAPFHIFLSADESYIMKLHASGQARDAGTLYAIGRIVLAVPVKSGLDPDAGLKGISGWLKDGRIRRLAIANPEHAPYGKRAEEALRSQGVWDAVRSRLVLGENVSQAAQFAVSGSADVGIFALSLAKSPQIARLVRYSVIPENLHTPLRQRMVLLKKADSAAEDFYRYMQSPAARAVMLRYGFALPGEGS